MCGKRTYATFCRSSMHMCCVGYLQRGLTSLIPFGLAHQSPMPPSTCPHVLCRIFRASVGQPLLAAGPHFRRRCHQCGCTRGEAKSPWHRVVHPMTPLIRSFSIQFGRTRVLRVCKVDCLPEIEWIASPKSSELVEVV